ncbi:calmodulin-binding protein 60 B-like [Mercurialis annua]|uniref:calmodulin-binding protein 60 B-like n=1 Tax=Mercurialis annua TaxID=3986 RepID=UPI0024AD94C2|nr:calmodulin-binding protein 60 B-like [Mercurialis annua]
MNNVLAHFPPEIYHRLNSTFEPPGTIFTGSRVVTEDGNPIRIELLDAKTKTLVTFGPVSCMKIEILVLDGDFGSDDREDWTENQFNANLIREREGRRPLLAGELNVTLRGGVALVNDIAFTDNSSWQRSRKFRLGAKPVSRTCGGNGQAMVREARSEAFKVMDHRGE